MNFRDLKPKNFFDGTARKLVRERLIQSDSGLRKDEYDRFGGTLDDTVDVFTFMAFLHRFYFRVDVHGIENLPDAGRGLIVSNHAGLIPFDAFMLGVTAVMEKNPPRFVRCIVNKFISGIPFFSTMISRVGQVIGCDENVRDAFENESLTMVFPTGNEARSNTIFKPYQVHEFAMGFMEYALRYDTPIIPTCVTGSEEAVAALAEVNMNLAGFKRFPITPIFPWFGLLGLVPFPSKFDIYFGEPVDYFTEHRDDADRPEKVRLLVEDLRQRIQGMLDEARRAK